MYEQHPQCTTSEVTAAVPAASHFRRPLHLPPPALPRFCWRFKEASRAHAVAAMQITEPVRDSAADVDRSELSATVRAVFNGVLNRISAFSLNGKLTPRIASAALIAFRPNICNRACAFLSTPLLALLLAVRELCFRYLQRTQAQPCTFRASSMQLHDQLMLRQGTRRGCFLPRADSAGSRVVSWRAYSRYSRPSGWRPTL